MIRPKTLNPDGTLLTVSQWAEKHRVVNVGPRPGQWSNEVTPYLVEPMDAATDPNVNEIILCFAPQTGKTQVALNIMGYCIDQDPDDFMFCMSTESTMRRTMRQKILPMLRSSPAISKQLPKQAHDETLYNVSFQNGMSLFCVWATSASELASESIRFAVFDETDKYPAFSGREADPISLGKVRTTTYGDDALVLLLSTPTTETGAISRAMDNEADEVRHYMAVCPECGVPQQMDTGLIRWPETVRDPRAILRKKLAWYECAHCQATWNDHLRDQAVRAGFWEANQEIDRPRAIGFHLPSFYSPFVSLSKVAADFLRAEAVRDSDKEEYLGRRMFFVTQHEARPWKERQRTADLEEMRSCLHPEIPGGIAPAGTVALTLSVDMQKNHFLYSVRACGRFNQESEQWQTATIDYGRIESWDALKQMITETTWPVAGADHRMVIYRVALDTGGGESDSGMSRTEEAYRFLSGFPPGRVVGVKGASGKRERSITVSRVDVLPGSRNPIKPLVLYLLDTGTFKDLFWERVQDGSHFFSADTGDDFLRQLLAEEKVLQRGRYVWKQRGGRANHYLDCAMLHEGMNSSLWKPDLKALRQSVGTVRNTQHEQQAQKPQPRQPNQQDRSNKRKLPSWFNRR